MSKVIDIRTREEKQDLPVYAVSDCQGERNGPDTYDRRMSAAGALHRCVKEMQSEFGDEFTGDCLRQEYFRVRRSEVSNS